MSQRAPETHARRRLILVLAGALALNWTRPALAIPAPAAQRVSSYPISERALALIEPMDRDQLADDTEFAAVLARLVGDPGLSPVEKVDGFFLLLRKIKWAFTGSVQIPAGYAYCATYSWRAETLLAHQRQLESLKVDSQSILQVAADKCATEVVRCSNAVLLATLIDRKAAAPTVVSLLKPELIEAAQVPDILLHHLSLAAVLTRDHKVAAELGRLLSRVNGEEAQEDILCALGLFASPETAALTEPFLLSALAIKFDSAVETGILVLRRQLRDPAVFRSHYAQLIQATANPEYRARLVALEREGFKSIQTFGAGSGWVKTWDGFDLVIYDDGWALSHGAGFRDFIPY